MEKKDRRTRKLTQNTNEVRVTETKVTEQQNCPPSQKYLINLPTYCQQFVWGFFLNQKNQKANVTGDNQLLLMRKESCDLDLMSHV